MRGKDKQKICSHCEGRVAIEADNCLYCGMPLLAEKSSVKEEINPLYPPLYSRGNVMGEQEAPVVESKAEGDHTGFLSVFLALLGSNLLVIGLMQAFFSQDGFLRLEWSSKYWFIICLIAVPLLYFGLRKKPEPREGQAGL